MCHIYRESDIYEIAFSHFILPVLKGNQKHTVIVIRNMKSECEWLGYPWIILICMECLPYRLVMPIQNLNFRFVGFTTRIFRND